MDPTRQLSEPIAEVRAQAPTHIDSFGDVWTVIDGIETKVGSVKRARALLVHQDAVRLQIRADLDALGIRDAVVEEEITVDGEKVTVGLLPPGDAGANILQIGGFNEASDLQQDADELIKKKMPDWPYGGQLKPVAKEPACQQPQTLVGRLKQSVTSGVQSALRTIGLGRTK